MRSNFYKIAKRGLDLFGSLVGLIIMAPLFLLIPIMIKVLMPGSVLFKQVRVGRNGNKFIMFKFRTMIEHKIVSTISIRGDSRITTLGAILRKFKLDELPELFNVVKGDMSLVGPRPDVPEYICKLTVDERAYLTIRPGLTSPASLKYSQEESLIAAAADPVKFYNEVIWPDKVRLNLEYYRNRSFLETYC